VINVLRAQERSAQFVFYSVLKKYFSLAIVVVVVVWFARDLWGFYIATIVTEGIAVALLLYLICRGQQSLPRNFSWPMMKTMAAFGIPMVVYEVTFVVLQLGDRFVIQGVLGNEAVGLYSAAYNLCEYTGMVFVTGFVQAVQPMYVRLWEQRGVQATQEFVRQALHFYLLVSAAIVAGLAATAHELIALLASEKYADGAVVVPLVATGVMLSGMLPLTGAALYLNKTKSIMTLVAIVAALNLVLNVALVPPLGLMGSAWATLISSCVLLVLAGRVAARVLPIAFPWAAAMKFVLAAAAMYIVVMQIEMSNHIAQLSAKVIAGVIVFSGIVLAADAQSRVAARTGLDRVLRRFGRGSAEAPS
jgi:O-antigen/teichoic acid export membrane protein